MEDRPYDDIAELPDEGQATVTIEVTWNADKSPGELTLKIDSMSELGETESLRLQVAMDRKATLMTTLSNLLKKISDVQSQITANIK